MFWTFIDVLQAWSWIKNFQQQYTYIIKGGKIWKGFISVLILIMVEHFIVQGKIFSNRTQKYFKMKAQILLSSPTTNHNNWQKVKNEKKNQIKKRKTKRLLCVTLGGLEWRLSKMHLLQRTLVKRVSRGEHEFNYCTPATVACSWLETALEY